MADSMIIDDGGPAFSVCFEGGQNNGDQPYFHEGMSLRDWYAGQALAGEFAAQNEITGEITNNTPDEWMFERAQTFYRMADAMIAARKGGA
ncbi:hypothetical protein [Rhizobium sp. 11515TR]|uniref:hypothetical protein n=1 Tax=Rhizobium sp. 11515TR TaxID=2028343 RepID=UPI000BA8AEF3|nr:hypothetical protein [Rhizobium sp. 11515TR]ASW06265.1 hypothetical protein CKA34_10470 [Rhizobium sp. 11515TR]